MLGKNTVVARLGGFAHVNTLAGFWRGGRGDIPVVDMASLASAISSLKTAGDIAKAMIGLHDARTVQAKVIELNGIILSAQHSALTAQSDQLTLLERVRELEKEIARLKAWETEKQRYQLTDIGDGTFAYAIKESVSGGEPPHYICANCYEQAKKSILNRSRMPSGGDLLTCSSCNAKLIIRHGYTPPSYATSPQEKMRLALPPCPLCEAGRLKTTKVEKDPTFGPVGVQRLTLSCDRCGHVETRQYDPNK